MSDVALLYVDLARAAFIASMRAALAPGRPATPPAPAPEPPRCDPERRCRCDDGPGWSWPMHWHPGEPVAPWSWLDARAGQS